MQTHGKPDDLYVTIWEDNSNANQSWNLFVYIVTIGSV